MAQKGERKGSGLVWEIAGLEVDTLEIHPDYCLEFHEKNRMTDTGAWNLFTVTHRSGSPKYRGRWDQKESALDVDRIDTSSGRLYKNFKGHKTGRPNGTAFEFVVNIKATGARVFRGTVRFPVTTREHFHKTDSLLRR